MILVREQVQLCFLDVMDEWLGAKKQSSITIRKSANFSMQY